MKNSSAYIELRKTRRNRVSRPRIAGTRITVQRIAVWYKMGMKPEEIIA